MRSYLTVAKTRFRTSIPNFLDQVTYRVQSLYKLVRSEMILVVEMTTSNCNVLTGSTQLEHNISIKTIGISKISTFEGLIWSGISELKSMYIISSEGFRCINPPSAAGSYRSQFILEHNFCCGASCQTLVSSIYLQHGLRVCTPRDK
jgi:hypothetical protein